MLEESKYKMIHNVNIPEIRYYAKFENTTAKDGKTPLQMKLAELSKILTYLVIGISIKNNIYDLITRKECSEFR